MDIVDAVVSSDAIITILSFNLLSDHPFSTFIYLCWFTPVVQPWRRLE